MNFSGSFITFETEISFSLRKDSRQIHIAAGGQFSAFEDLFGKMPSVWPANTEPAPDPYPTTSNTNTQIQI